MLDCAGCPVHYTRMDIANALPILHADMKLGLPTFVKVAHWPDASQISHLPVTAFADGKRQFPIFSKAAAFCSALIASADGCDDKTLNRITDACIDHGIADEVLKYTSLFDTVKCASYQSSMTHALVIDNAKDFGHNQDTLYMLPASSQLEVEDSISELDKSASTKLPPELVREAAMNLMKAAEEYSVVIPTGSVVDRLGHDRLPDYEKAAFLIERRISVVPESSMVDYREVVGFLKTAGMEQNVIDGLRDLDSQHGVNYGFGSAVGQPSPWEIVFSGPNDNDVMKMAGSHILIADCPIPIEALTSVADKNIDARFLKVAADAIKQAKAASAFHATELISGLTETQQVTLLDLVLEIR